MTGAMWTFPDVDQGRTSAGVPLLACAVPDRPLAAVRVLLPAGAAHDPVGAYGRAALTARGLTEGPSGSDGPATAIGFERLGATIAIDAGWDVVTVSLDVPASALDPALELVGELLLDPGFPATGMRRLAGEQADALRQQACDPRASASQLLVRALFAGGRYAVPIDGVPDEVAALDATAVTEHYRRHPGAAAVIAIGTVDVAAAGEWLPDLGRAAVAPGEGVGTAAPAGPRVIVRDRPGAVQSAVSLGRRTPPRSDPEHPALMLAVNGGLAAFTGRVPYRLREERGYTYGVAAGLEFRREVGVLSALFSVGTECTAAAMADAVAALRELRDGGLRAEELAQARTALVDAAALRLETCADLADVLAQQSALDLPPQSFDRTRARLATVGADDVDRAAATYLDPDALTFAIVGDASVIVPELDAVGIDAVEVL